MYTFLPGMMTHMIKKFFNISCKGIELLLFQIHNMSLYLHLIIHNLCQFLQHLVSNNSHFTYYYRNLYKYKTPEILKKNFQIYSLQKHHQIEKLPCLPHHPAPLFYNPIPHQPLQHLSHHLNHPKIQHPLFPQHPPLYLHPLPCPLLH